MPDKIDDAKRERIRTFGEVFTPPEIVSHICDMLEDNDPDCFDVGRTFLEPACGEGAFVLEILRRKFLRCRCRADFSTAVASVWAMDIQQRNVEATIALVTDFCGQFFHPTKADLETISNHYMLADSLKVMRMMNDLNDKGGAPVER